MKLKSYILLYIIYLGISGTATSLRAQAIPTPQPDSIRISLLTCAAGGEIYALFGHTAIRYENFTKGIDVVYNYGVFDFDSPNFILRFALGETDYQLARNRFQPFALSYAYAGRDVWQQVLNLHQVEKERLVQQLEENHRPENRVYRYNFFYDNCSTRPRDQIERAVTGSVRYADDMETPQTDTTFRDLLHLYSEGHPWARFAMDFCMGSEADKPISRRVRQFVPFYLQSTFDSATVTDTTGLPRPLVTETDILVQTGLTAADHREKNYPTPLQCGIALWLAVTAATLYGIRQRKSLWGLDFALFLCAGVAGCVPAFLVLFSQHPAVCPNYLLAVLHPLHLCLLPWVIRKVKRQKTSRYMMVNLVALTLFIILWAVWPQHFPLAMLFVALCLLERSASNIMLGKANKQHPTPNQTDRRKKKA